MNKITEITRRDIFDIICSGFNAPITVSKHIKSDYEVETEEEYKFKMCYYGKLSELDFLSRLYDLNKLPSTDGRFNNAARDIFQHTINNDDWDTDWVFTDYRFELNSGKDEILLKFLCEMFHPLVRNEKEPWHEFLNIFNELLKLDGYEIYEKNHISGRVIYGWKLTDDNSITIKDNKPTSTYELKIIGEGSYAHVYKFHDDFYNHTFALKRAKKELNEKELSRFKREFDEMKTCDCPYIIKVYNYFNETNEYIMEFMNFTLDEYIKKNNDKLKFIQRKNIVRQIFRGFQYLHSKNRLHRDISPKNILIKQHEDILVVKISDFGLIKIPESGLTSLNTEYKGYFNDPELRLEGFNNYTIVHETYAITRLVFFIICGRTNTDKIKNETLNNFVRRGLNPDKSKRFQNIEELMKMFENVHE